MYGVRLATERRRPVDLAGALLAAAGLALALLAWDDCCPTDSSDRLRIRFRRRSRLFRPRRRPPGRSTSYEFSRGGTKSLDSAGFWPMNSPASMLTLNDWLEK